MTRLWLASLVLSTSCVAGTEPAEDDFVAIEADFADLLSWQRRELPDDGDGELEAIYVNAEAAAMGGPPFGPGAIVVKAHETGPPLAWTLFAMVRRSSDYEGAMPGWELVELYVDETSRPRILWRGPRAPLSNGYSGLSGETCESCHADPGRQHTLSFE